MKKLVKSLKQDGSFESQWGTFFKHIIEFDDGMIAEYLSKTETQNKFIVGKETEVELTSREYNGTTINKVKPVSPDFKPSNNYSNNQSNNSNVQELIVKQNALTNACNIVGESDIAKILEIADAFKEWVLNDVKPTKTKSNDLPF